MKKRVNMYVFFVVAFIITFSIVRASAYSSLELFKYVPEITDNSLFIKLAIDR